MVRKGISCAASHGIKVHHGIPNLANGNCAFESVIDGISRRNCFQESYDGCVDYWRKKWMS